jgi:hypothetical protein
VNAVIGDLLVSARADSTWKAYVAWVEVFIEFLKKLNIPLQPVAANWEQWVQALLTVVAVLSQCYSAGTIGIVVSAVSA